jgi:CheY-like chemotaxis protein
MPRTLLLADDSVTIQKVVGISFASEDVALITVDNGDDAIARAREVRPDIVLADVVMPGKSGYEVCEAIKADPGLQHIPVLLLTGTFEAFDEERAQRAGASGHVSKPFEAQTLVDEVNRLLAEGASAAAAAPTPPTTPELDAEGTDESFEFFDEDLEEPAPEQAPAGAELMEADSLDIGGPDPTFAFSDAEFAPAASEPPPAEETPGIEDLPRPLGLGAAEHTIAILPEQSASEAEQQGLGESDLTALDAVFEQPGPSEEAQDLMRPDFVEPDAEEAPEPLAAELLGEADNSATEEITAPNDSSETEPLEPPSPAADEAFAFDFESVTPVSASDPVAGDDPLLRIDSDDLAQATVLDPSGASGFDVSSSDLGEPLAAEPSQSEQSLSAAMEMEPPDELPVAEPMAELEMEPPDELPGAEPMAELEMEPSDSLPDAEPMAPLEIEPPDELPGAEPMGALEMEPSDSLPDALGAPEPVSEAIAAPTARPSEPATQVNAALSEIAPRLREQLHDTLEKVAWESFSDVTETIVRQALERVESVAWEVIPQLAETLVREEIRRMKGQTEDS